MNHKKQLIVKLLDETPIKINGSNPWDVQINDDSFYGQVLKEGSIGLGESYMQGKWESDQIDEMINIILQHNLDEKVHTKFDLITKLRFLLFNLQSKTRAYILQSKIAPILLGENITILVMISLKKC
ncbi:hypothetical protein PT276_10355 [Orbaceae bacterium ESL0721]|nr:hypothetical protein [Orbaceae bacterium ESL0721]